MANYYLKIAIYLQFAGLIILCDFKSFADDIQDDEESDPLNPIHEDVIHDDLNKMCNTPIEINDSSGRAEGKYIMTFIIKEQACYIFYHKLSGKLPYQ